MIVRRTSLIARAAVRLAAYLPPLVVVTVRVGRDMHNYVRIEWRRS